MTLRSVRELLRKATLLASAAIPLPYSRRAGTPACHLVGAGEHCMGTELSAKGGSGRLGLRIRREDVCFRHRATFGARGHSLILVCILQAAARNRRAPAFLHGL